MRSVVKDSAALAPGPERPLANIARAVRRTFDWRRRATRAEYWWFFGVMSVGGMLCATLDEFAVEAVMTTRGLDLEVLVDNFRAYPAYSAFVVATLPTYLALCSRRNHDRGKAGWPAWVMVILLVDLFYEPTVLSLDNSEVSPRQALREHLYVTVAVGVIYLITYLYGLWIGVHGSDGANRYGPNPYEGRQADVFA